MDNMDIHSIMEKLLVTALGKPIVEPAAVYLKNILANYSKQMLDNVTSIFKIANNKLKNLPEKNGAISERVLKAVIEEGAMIDDLIAQQYFAGALVGSVSDSDKRDDRGIYYVSLIKRMSSYQLRTHYILYHIVKKLCDSNGMCIGGKEYREELEIFVPYSVYCEAMDFNKQEMQRLGPIVQQTIWGLETDSLILKDSLFHGGVRNHRSNYSTFKDKNIPDGLLFRPSTQGVQLFYWANGQPDLILNNFLKPEYKFDIDSSIIMADGSLIVSK